MSLEEAWGGGGGFFLDVKRNGNFVSIFLGFTYFYRYLFVDRLGIFYEERFKD